MRHLCLPLLVAAFLAAPARGAAFLPSPWLKYDLTAEQLAKECALVRERALSRLAEITSIPDQARAFSNTAEAFDRALWDFNDEASAPIFLKDVAVSSAVRAASGGCATSLEQFLVDVYTREDLYEALKVYASKKEPLEGASKKLLAKELLDFRRNGLDLQPAKRAELKKIRLRLAELQIQFDKNINEVKDALLVSREELEGLPADFVARLEKEGEQYKVSLDYPDYFPFMNNAKSAHARQLLEGLFNNRAAKENLPLLSEVLHLRAQAAKLLGYPSHSHYVLEERMAKKPSEVRSFLGRLEDKLKPMAKKELSVLLELKKKEEGERADGKLHAWDWRYYDNLLKKTKYQVDDEKIKEYFPMDVVTEGMLAVYQKLLGLKFRELPGAAVWHPDVKLYEISDAAGGEPVAHFYMDLFPREGKYKHAAAFSLIQGRSLSDASYVKPVSAMVANFDKPTKERPSLLKHRDVETYFHEFGHIMHQTLTKARYGRFSGSNVARDFVEAPSQMLEEWVWSPEVLTLLSGHYKDRSKKLPKDLLDLMVAAKNVNSGLVNLRQIFFGTIDMRYHTSDDIKDTTAEYLDLMERVSLIPMSPGTHPEASFGHLMGYDSGYYGYLWSLVFAADMFSRFEAEGILNPAIGRLYRELILEPGSSIDEAASLRTFLGREPNETAFLKSIGLTQ